MANRFYRTSQQSDNDPDTTVSVFRAEGPSSGFRGRVPAAEVEMAPPHWENNFGAHPGSGRYEKLSGRGNVGMNQQGTLFHRQSGKVTRKVGAPSMPITATRQLLRYARQEHAAQWKDADPQPLQDHLLKESVSPMEKTKSVKDNPNWQRGG